MTELTFTAERTEYPHYDTRRYHHVCPTCGADAVIEYRPGTTGDTWRAIEHCNHLHYPHGMSQWLNGTVVFSARHVLADPNSWKEE